MQFTLDFGPNWGFLDGIIYLLHSGQKIIQVQKLFHLHIVYKLLKRSHLNSLILAFSTNFCPIKTGMSGNTV